MNKTKTIQHSLLLLLQPRQLCVSDNHYFPGLQDGRTSIGLSFRVEQCLLQAHSECLLGAEGKLLEGSPRGLRMAWSRAITLEHLEKVKIGTQSWTLLQQSLNIHNLDSG